MYMDETRYMISLSLHIHLGLYVSVSPKRQGKEEEVWCAGAAMTKT